MARADTVCLAVALRKSGDNQRIFLGHQFFGLGRPVAVYRARYDIVVHFFAGRGIPVGHVLVLGDIGSLGSMYLTQRGHRATFGRESYAARAADAAAADKQSRSVLAYFGGRIGNVEPIALLGNDECGRNLRGGQGEHLCIAGILLYLDGRSQVFALKEQSRRCALA